MFLVNLISLKKKSSTLSTINLKLSLSLSLSSPYTFYH